MGPQGPLARGLVYLNSTPGITPMNPAEEIVKFWLQEKGYFVQSSIHLKQNREIDILAIDKDGKEKSHIEVSVSVRSQQFEKNAQQLAQEKYGTKFNTEAVKQAVEKRLGENYKMIFVTGKVAKGKTDITTEFIGECKKLGIEVVLFQKILNEIRTSLGTSSHLNPIIKTVQLTEVFEKDMSDDQ
jgi:Holliday junction resolvase-like predicted endonuclease